MRHATKSRRGARFDVFLIYRHTDSQRADKLAQQLKTHRVQPWLDKEQVIAGQWFQDAMQAALGRVSCAAVLIGRNTPGGWQHAEIRFALSLCIRRNIWVIPVLLPGATRIPNSLRFLQEMHCVRFGKSTSDAGALQSLVRGIKAACAQRRGAGSSKRSRSNRASMIEAVA